MPVKRAVRALPELERIAPVRRREPLGGHAGGRGEAAVHIQISAELAVAQVGDERRRGVRIVAPDDVVNRAGGVLDGAHEVELVTRGIELGSVRQDLEEPERQDDRTVGPLLVNHVDGDVAGGTDAANGDAAGVDSDRMVVHDEQIGMMLAKLDELGIADNTIVMYSTDNGPENDTWPDGATTPFRGQKDSNWEGGWRVPCFMRWPGTIKPDSVLNGIVSHIDMFPTLLAAAGNPDVTKQLLDGCTVDGKKFNVHLDGYNMVPYLSRQGEGKSATRHRLLQRRW